MVVFAVSYDIQKLCGIKIQLSIDSENRVLGEENRKATKRFMDKYKASWEVDVKKRARHVLRERKLNAMTELPDPADIAKLAQHMQERMQMMESPLTYDEFRTCQYLTMARLIAFNRRRPGEVQVMK